MVTRADIIQFIGNMTVAELPDFIDELKKTLKIPDAPMFAAPSAGAAAAGESAEVAAESSEKILVITNPGAAKVSVIKVMRECMKDLSLTDAKKILDNFAEPFEVKKGPKEELAKLKASFEAAGAQMEIR